jgi:pimeloyl-ACP methyl ester carboxylesterase
MRLRSRVIVVTLGLLAAAYVGVGGLLWLAQDVMLFPAPTVSDARLARFAERLGAEEVRIEASDGVAIYGLYLPAEGEKLVLFFHGNGEYAGLREDHYAVLRAQGWDVLAGSYRGYPGGQGAPSQAGIERDARAFWDHAVNERGFSPDRIVLYGVSLGGGAVGTLLDDVEPAGVVLESTFASAIELASRQAPIWPVSLLFNHPFRTIDAAPVSAPVLVMHGEVDGVIPVDHGRRLAVAFDAGFVEAPGFGHNQSLGVMYAPARKALVAFLDSL